MNKSLNSQLKEVFYSELSTLLDAGLDFATAFHLIIDTQSNRSHKKLFEKLFRRIVAGEPFWMAMENCDSFSKLDYGVIRIGEQSGKLSESLNFLSAYYKKQTEQKRMIISAVSYPLIILFVALVVVGFMLTVVVPMFKEVYIRMGRELPAMTQWIIGISNKLPLLLTLFGLFASSMGFLVYFNRDKERTKMLYANFILRTPIIGKIVKRSTEATFCKLMALLLHSGVPLLSGLELVGSIIKLQPYRHSISKICDELHRGATLYESLTKYPNLYDKKLLTLIRVGEQTNQLSQMMTYEGENLSRDIEFQIRRLGSSLEPLLILFIGSLVAVVLISMYLPMFKLGGVIN